jgi:hypothetical protein
MTTLTISPVPPTQAPTRSWVENLALGEGFIDQGGPSGQTPLKQQKPPAQGQTKIVLHRVGWWGEKVKHGQQPRQKMIVKQIGQVHSKNKPEFQSKQEPELLVLDTQTSAISYYGEGPRLEFQIMNARESVGKPNFHPSS